MYEEDTCKVYWIVSVWLDGGVILLNRIDGYCREVEFILEPNTDSREFVSAYRKFMLNCEEFDYLIVCFCILRVSPLLMTKLEMTLSFSAITVINSLLNSTPQTSV